MFYQHPRLSSRRPWIYGEKRIWGLVWWCGQLEYLGHGCRYDLKHRRMARLHSCHSRTGTGTKILHSTVGLRRSAQYDELYILFAKKQTAELKKTISQVSTALYIAFTRPLRGQRMHPISKLAAGNASVLLLAIQVKAPHSPLNLANPLTYLQSSSISSHAHQSPSLTLFDTHSV